MPAQLIIIQKRTPQLLNKHRDILKNSDERHAHRIGSLLRVAEAINRSESIAAIEATKKTTRCRCNSPVQLSRYWNLMAWKRPSRI